MACFTQTPHNHTLTPSLGGMSKVIDDLIRGDKYEMIHIIFPSITARTLRTGYSSLKDYCGHKMAIGSGRSERSITRGQHDGVNCLQRCAMADNNIECRFTDVLNIFQSIWNFQFGNLATCSCWTPSNEIRLSLCILFIIPPGMREDEFFIIFA